MVYLWSTNDARNTLTWSNRLANFGSVDVYNFYSSGEDVLRDYPGTPPSSLFTLLGTELVEWIFDEDLGTYAWAWQEKNKGLMSGNSFESGWPSSRPSREVGAIASGEWHHSDLCVIAYPFVYQLFNQLVTSGNLK